jgi:ferredoxin-NADP reductase
MLAVATTAHLALAFLRKHRETAAGRQPILSVPSFFLAILPWAAPGVAALAAGLAGHALWFAACEKAGRARQAGTPSAPPAETVSLRPPASQPAGSSFVDASVVAIFEETPDIRTFRLRRPAGFEFRPGQHLIVRLGAPDGKLVRCYTISSAPEARGYLEISVRNQGAVSSALHSTLRVGSLLSIRGPAGRFIYPENDARPLVLVAGGVGITPLICMIRHGVAAEPTRPMALFLSVRNEEDVPFREELRLLARRHPNLRVVVALTRGPAGPGFHSGRIDAPLLQTVLGDLGRPVYYVCGPTAMISELRQTLGRLGVPEAQVRSEAFASAVAASQEAETGSPSVDAHRLELRRSGRTVAISRGKTLLDAAEAAGVQIDFSCRSGVCGTCLTRLVSGQVECDAEGLDPADRERGFTLPCVARAMTDCVLDA